MINSLSFSTFISLQTPKFLFDIFHSLSILSLFSASFLRVFIQLLSYSPSTLMSFWLSYSASQCNFQSSHYFYPCSPSLLPWSVSSGHVSLPSSLPLYKFCNNHMLFFWPLPIWFLHPSRSISLHLFVPLSLSLSLSQSVISFFYFGNFSLWVFYCILLISLLLNLSLFIFFFSQLYVTVSFL